MNNEEIPRMNEFVGNQYKFIQVYVKGEAYLRFSEKENTRHQFLLIDLLGEFGLKYDKKTDSEGNKLVNEKGKDYEMVGAGRAFYNNSGKIVLYFLSADYSIDTNKEHLDDLCKHVEQAFKVESMTYIPLLKEMNPKFNL